MYSFLQAGIAGVHEKAVAAASGSASEEFSCTGAAVDAAISGAASGSASEEFSYTGPAVDAAISGAASAWPWSMTIEQQQEWEANQKCIDALAAENDQFNYREVQIAVRAYSVDLRDIQIVVLLMILLSLLAS